MCTPYLVVELIYFFYPKPISVYNKTIINCCRKNTMYHFFSMCYSLVESNFYGNNFSYKKSPDYKNVPTPWQNSSLRPGRPRSADRPPPLRPERRPPTALATGQTPERRPPTPDPCILNPADHRNGWTWLWHFWNGPNHGSMSVFKSCWPQKWVNVQDYSDIFGTAPKMSERFHPRTVLDSWHFWNGPNHTEYKNVRAFPKNVGAEQRTRTILNSSMY